MSEIRRMIDKRSFIINSDKGPKVYTEAAKDKASRTRKAALDKAEELEIQREMNRLMADWDDY